MRGLWRAVAGMLVWGAALPVLAGGAGDALAAANAFRLALRGSDAAAATALLASELLVYESGEENPSRSDYAGGHLKADMAFLKGATVRVLDQRAAGDGDLAWVTTRSRVAAHSTELLSTETLVLRRDAEGWRIVHIHWSSQAAPKGRN